MKNEKITGKKISVIGLGYVGLPLAIEFAKFFKVVAFDIDPVRIKELRLGLDKTGECSKNAILQSTSIAFTDSRLDLISSDVYIITVPTPVDDAKRPDLSALRSATEVVGSAMRLGSIIIYESTVYPGLTEEFCVPLLEEFSGLKFNQDFFCGYSPERINPGDHVHSLTHVKKITSGSTKNSADVVDQLYRQIITAGTHKVSSIRVAEAAKVIENIQRDVNIALINELSILFKKLEIDTTEVLDAAATKWNFLSFRPGLVGGHCIGVDPYYLTHKAIEVGYYPEIILAGRRINDSMAPRVAQEMIRLLSSKNIPLMKSHVLILGLAFKENCPDLRNTKVVDIVKELNAYSVQVDIYDPLVDTSQALSEYGLECLEGYPSGAHYSGIILAVPHSEFLDLGVNKIKSLGRSDAIFFDVKSVFSLNESDARL